MLAAGAMLLMGASCATGPGGTASRPAEMSKEDVVRLQVFLDSQNFGPGIIDGREGEFTQKALVRYNASRGLPPEAFPDLRGVAPFTTYTITSDDRGRLGSMAGDRSVIAQQKSQPYTSLVELLAERFHTSRAFIAALNPGLQVNNLGAGAQIQVPNVSSPLYVTEIPTTSKTARVSNPALGGRSLIVDLRSKMLELRDSDGQMLAAFPITPGSSQHPAPKGQWKIVGITTFPWYRYDEGVLKRGERTEDFFNLPPGPNSPVGIVWMGLDRPGIGIHGTSTPETIGRSGSHGCIRLANWDAAKLFPMVTAGTPVSIQ